MLHFRKNNNNNTTYLKLKTKMTAWENSVKFEFTRWKELF